MPSKQYQILLEDQDILVCTKPHGLPVQSRSIMVPDLESMLKTHLSQDAGSRRAPYLAVIHRLDQPVSGILVFAKTKKSAAALNAQLTSGSFEKYYRALTDGCPPCSCGTCTDYLVKNGRTNTSAICSADTPGARKAVLEYSIVSDRPSFFPGAAPEQTELQIHLLTGRHHQIRVQLAGMGCPIAGDTKYNPSAARSGTWQELKLCAFRLAFTHPSTGRRLSFRLEQDL